ncbi:MAG: amidohydrolase [Microbacterium sp.]
MNRGERVDVIADVRIGGEGRELMPLALVDEAAPYDVHLAGGRIVDIAPAGSAPHRGAVLDAAGGWLVPGMWDHHVHALPWALEARRVALGDAASASEAAAIMGAAVPSDDGIRVGSGMRDALWPDAPESDLLDRLTEETPTYLLNADLHSAWLNSAALRSEGFSATDGVVREEDAFELIRRLSAVDEATADLAMSEMADRAAARGVVGIVDMHMEWGGDDWRRRAAAGFDGLRVELAVYTHRLEEVIAAGLATGDPLPDAGELIRMGPYKVISDGSLGTRTAACSHPYDADAPAEARGHLNVSPDELVAHMTRAAGAGLASAVHAIGDVAVSHALDAFAASGAAGTIEHAQLVRHADIARFARLGVAASVQPTHAVEDRDLVDALWASQTSLPYAWRALDEAEANLRFGSDAPVSALDPWTQIAAAVHRRDDGRDAWRPADALGPATALAASTRGGSRAGARILPGEPADLAIAAVDPLRAGEDELRRMDVVATLLGGRLTHLA